MNNNKSTLNDFVDIKDSTMILFDKRDTKSHINFLRES